MSESIRLLLAESIDYAGVFPPARLSLNQSLQNYVRYLRDPEAWLIARFACPAVRLRELDARARVLKGVRPWRRVTDRIDARLRKAAAEQLGVEPGELPDSMIDGVDQFGSDALDMTEFVTGLEDVFDLNAAGVDLESLQSFDRLSAVIRNQFPHRVAVVAAASENAKQFRDDLRHDISNIVAFHETHSDYAKVDALELKLPADLDSSTSKPIVDLLNSVRHQLETAELNPVKVIVELRPREPPEGVLAMLDALGTMHDEHFCLKIRAGGLPRDDMPSADQFAFFIDACCTGRVRWKATAGLHAPLSRFDGGDHIWHFGFLNVFAAAVLAFTQRITQGQVKAILTENAGDVLEFLNTSISWGDFELTIAEIEEGRAHSIMSFGSCSFEEPRDGLRDWMRTA